ncbi:hypothetical protein Tcan_13192 [Toxocara canis]|uniref:Uncharacterized protein n=1 Tax=Toxocara canis TaxID=6265 RepID=A0A0B2W6K9_TOXCA|nr:hypothetical protein Tcan_13192 [Toxocara canis]
MLGQDQPHREAIAPGKSLEGHSGIDWHQLRKDKLTKTQMDVKNEKINDNASGDIIQKEHEIQEFARSENVLSNQFDEYNDANDATPNEFP